MKYLFDKLNEIKARLGDKLFLLLDYDGTLTPIVKKPEFAVLHKPMKASLTKLCTKHPVAIISGRALEDVKKLVGIKDIYYAGNHGFEISNDKSFVLPKALATKPLIGKLCSELEAQLRVKGALVENKGLTASLHFRLVAQKDLPKLRKIFSRVAEPWIQAGKIRITLGKKVFELRPNLDWDKGKAVEWVIKVMKKQEFLPIYVGDDLTDEDAFLALRKNGVTVLVTERAKRSYAKYWVKNVNEVAKFLKLLTKF